MLPPLFVGDLPSFMVCRCATTSISSLCNLVCVHPCDKSYEVIRMAKIIPTLRKQNHPLSQTEQQRQILEAVPLRSFAEAAASVGHRPLRANGIEVLQINVGKRCNQTCAHCHVDAGPDRKEVMAADVLE